MDTRFALQRDDWICNSLDYCQRLNELPAARRRATYHVLNDVMVRPDSVPLFEAKGDGRHRYSGIIRIGDEFIEDTKAFYEGNFSALADISASFSYLPTGFDEPIEFA